MDYMKRCRAVVDLDRIVHNYRAVRGFLAPACKLMASVKADAYGHGLEQVARELEALGADWFGVSCIEEGLSLRKYGISAPILNFGYTPQEYAKDLAENDITQTVYCMDYAKLLHDAAIRAGVTLEIHIKLDTGMSRLGFFPDELDDAEAVCKMPHFHAGGIYTHLACADEANADAAAFTKSQFAKFTNAVRELESRGISFPLRHCCNSGGTVFYPEMHLDMVRPGIMLYGLCPGADLQGKIDIKPAMAWYSRVTMVKELPDGTPVSYGRTAQTVGARKIATVAVGYADGYPRAMSGRGRMIVRGQYTPVIGRVCMDQLMLDVTGIPGIEIGDAVTIAGDSLPFDELARLCGTISYETVCLVGKRVPRVYQPHIFNRYRDSPPS
ncbi:MAG: alanine racemase [Oscillospiraceae bacterium]|nr:alanine racemase [Oscillospiraceae bacterium]